MTSVTFTQEERQHLLGGYLMSGFFTGVDAIADRPGSLSVEMMDTLSFALRVSQALGAPETPGTCTIDDPSIILALRREVARSLRGLLEDEEFDLETPESRPVAISIERKLGVCRDAIAAEAGVDLDENGAPEDRRDSLSAQHHIAFRVREALEKVLPEAGPDLDRFSRPLILALAEAVVEAGGDRYKIEVPS